ncbi:hypothetical protein DXM21_20795 [Agrobacterium rosae]|nr:hypothetical protein DXM21_20795 [Agrobacterium rosae]KAA3516420.1 hypothetical protein DXM25_19000 [Agrobacterium rosae]MQB50213.1 hypothetical protein [Agrobacterium rosae]
MLAIASPFYWVVCKASMEADKGTQMSFTVEKIIPAARMRQFHQTVERCKVFPSVRARQLPRVFRSWSPMHHFFP